MRGADGCRIVVVTEIDAPIERVFDLARDPYLHAELAKRTREKVVFAAHPLLGLDDVVTFEAVHFGVRQALSARIVEYERPVLFVDEMERGAFRTLRHTHRFEPADGKTRMTDELVFTAPLGPLGRLAERLVLKRHLERFLHERGRALKRYAEGSSG